MAICLSETEAEARRHQSEMDRVAKTREAAELLSAKEDGNDVLQLLLRKKKFLAFLHSQLTDFKQHRLQP